MQCNSYPDVWLTSFFIHSISSLLQTQVTLFPLSVVIECLVTSQFEPEKTQWFIIVGNSVSFINTYLKKDIKHTNGVCAVVRTEMIVNYHDKRVNEQ